MSDRGMKKWAPYKSLPEHDPKIIEMEKNRQYIERPQISSDKAEEINEILTNYHGQLLHVKYYKMGKIKEADLTIVKIDINNKLIRFNDEVRIDFIDILDLQSI